MTDPNAPAPAVNPAAAPVPPAPTSPSHQPAVTPPAVLHRLSTVLVWLSLGLATAALVLGSMLWQKLGQTQQELARRSTDSAALSAEARTLAAQAEALTQELQARMGVAEIRLSEVSLQRSQLEELMLSVSRSRDDNLVQDLDSTLRLALQQTQLTGSAQPLLSALQAADQRIARAAQPRLNPVQRAIARDIERIQAATLTDVPALAQRLDELARLSDELVPVNAVVKARTTSLRPAPETAPEPEATAPDSAEAPTDDVQAAPEASTGAAWQRGWSRVSQSWSGFWQRVWADASEQARDLVRVTRVESPDAMLMAPEQAFWMRQNLKMQLLNARLALLARQFEAARADVANALVAVERYFEPELSASRAMRLGLQQVQADLRGDELPRPDETLAALATAGGGR